MNAHQQAVMLLAAKLHASKRRDNNRIHQAADAHLRAMTLAVNYAFMKGRKAVDKAALKSATTQRQAHEAMDAVPGAVSKTFKEVLPAALAACYAAGAQAGLKSLGKKAFVAPRAAAAGESRILAPFSIRFDKSSQEAIDWADKHAGELIDDLSETTISDIQDAIAGALEGDGIRAAYDDILAAVGDSDRAELIARTEVMTAANEGQRDAWDSAVEAGLLPDDSVVEWIATSDCCDDCADLDGETRPIDSEYDDPDAANGPPLHPNCRCTEGIGA